MLTVITLVSQFDSAYCQKRFTDDILSGVRDRP